MNLFLTITLPVREAIGHNILAYININQEIIKKSFYEIESHINNEIPIKVTINDN